MTTWTQLQADVIALSNRTDIADKIGRFVAIFEDRLRRNLRVAAMEEAFTGTTDENNEVAKPTGFLRCAGEAFQPGCDPLPVAYWAAAP